MNQKNTQGLAGVNAGETAIASVGKGHGLACAREHGQHHLGHQNTYVWKTCLMVPECITFTLHSTLQRPSC